MARASLTRFALLSIVAACLTIALKVAAWKLTGSVGLLSDALESLVNLFTAIVALVMIVIAERPADEGHPFGHGKAEYFASGFEGALILFAAGGIAMAAWQRVAVPQPLMHLDLGGVLSGVAAIINALVAWVLIRVGRRHRSMTLEADGRHLLSDVVTTLGILIALLGIHFTGWLWLDPLIAGLTAVQVLWSGTVLIHSSIHGLLDRALPRGERVKIISVLERYAQSGLQFHDLRTRSSGRHRFVNVHLLVPGHWTVQLAHDWSEILERDIRAVVGDVEITTHIEPVEDAASFDHETLASNT